MIKLSLRHTFLTLACLCLQLQPTAHAKSPLIPGTATVAFGGVAAKCLHLYRAKQAAEKAFLANPSSETEEAYLLLQKRFSLWKKVLVAAFGSAAVAWLLHLKGDAEQPTSHSTPQRASEIEPIATSPVSQEAEIQEAPADESTSTLRGTTPPATTSPRHTPTSQNNTSLDEQPISNQTPQRASEIEPIVTSPGSQAPESIEEEETPATTAPKHTPTPQNDTSLDYDSNDESETHPITKPSPRHSPARILTPAAPSPRPIDKPLSPSPVAETEPQPETPTVRFDELMKAIDLWGSRETIEQHLTAETVNLQDEHGRTPLAKALSMGDPKDFNREWLVRKLVDARADITKPLTFQNETAPMLPLFYAIEHCSLATQKELITAETANQQQNGAFPIVKLLEKQARTNNLQGALFLECFTKMLDAMTDPNLAKYNGHTLLIEALTGSGHYEGVLERLLSCLKIRRDRATNGQSPFEVALQQNKRMTVLIKLFCEEDTESYSLQQALDSGTQNKEAVVSFLMEKGIAPQAGNIKKAEENKLSTDLIRRMKALRATKLSEEASALAHSPDHNLHSVYTKLDEFAQEKLTIDPSLVDSLICTSLQTHPTTTVNDGDIRAALAYGLPDNSEAMKELIALQRKNEIAGIREKFKDHKVYSPSQMVQGLLALQSNDDDIRMLADKELAVHPGWSVDEHHIAQLKAYPKTQELFRTTNEKRQKAAAEVDRAETIADILALAPSLYDTEIRTHVARVIKAGHLPTKEELTDLNANPRYNSTSHLGDKSALELAQAAHNKQVREQNIARATTITELFNITNDIMRSMDYRSDLKRIPMQIRDAWWRKVYELLENLNYNLTKEEEALLLEYAGDEKNNYKKRIAVRKKRLILLSELEATTTVGQFFRKMAEWNDSIDDAIRAKINSHLQAVINDSQRKGIILFDNIEKARKYRLDKDLIGKMDEMRIERIENKIKGTTTIPSLMSIADMLEIEDRLTRRAIDIINNHLRALIAEYDKPHSTLPRVTSDNIKVAKKLDLDKELVKKMNLLRKAGLEKEQEEERLKSEAPGKADDENEEPTE